MSKKTQVLIVQQSVWEMPLESMPLAAGYLKSYALKHEDIRSNFEIHIRSFHGGHNALDMAKNLFMGKTPPDVLCFSVLGWNYNHAKKLAEMYKQFHPSGLLIFGGNHVSHQCERVFREIPEADVIVNGEGEITFSELLLKLNTPDQWNTIQGLSFRSTDGQNVTTEDRPRIKELDEIPSPVLNESIPMLSDTGEFRYDVAIMETNRGCPYKCSYCYWGGAVGQRIYSFSRERLKSEIEFYAKLKVETIVLCDANFGMLKQDLEFLKDLIECREKYVGHICDA